MAIVIGVDPGAAETGIAVINDAELDVRRCLLAHLTITRTDKVVDPYGDIRVNRVYLHEVNAAILDALRQFDATVMAYEGLKKPGGFKHGRKDLINPASLAAIGYVIGSITGRAWPVELVKVAPGGNGSNLVWNLYPEPIRMKAGGKGTDNKRHMRSAFDVALQWKQSKALAARR